ncbi:LytTR family two component transcriptional regulator [Winogradskyella wandonensis]|uniref:LytTR family two component transcriptional regulator n=1 Tax=Winogradskyella wandonensis TaxID=1442586 RepID=A0A4V2PU56_9FLAO|nr:LytTR family two component transcriptional regulator [Winogradskyella wandonensis]
MMNCIIIEDQLPAQRILKKYIEDAKSLSLVGTFSDAIEALETIKTQQVDVIFLDIHLPKLSGIDFLKSLSNPPKVILTTAFPDYALESYELNVVDYLLKPFSFPRFIQAITKASQMLESNSTNDSKNEPNQKKEIFIKSGYELVRLKIDDIIYIKSDADYVEIYTENKKLLSSDSLTEWIKRLDTNQFARVHKSYIINTNKIEKISGNRVYLQYDKKIPIGRAYKSDFTNKFLT